jgi:hypothetical protein
MKHLHLLLTLSLVLVLANVARADSFDSDMATIKKGKSDKSAMVMLDKKSYMVPVSFGDGASWDNVMDHYELSDASAKAVKSGHSSLLIGSDGSATWKK